MSDSPTTAEEKPSGMTPTQASRYWQVQLHLAERGVKEWHEYGDKVQKRYRADQNAKGKTRRKSFAILYANTETLKSALYARTPKPDARRRFGDRNPVARTTADMIERGLSYSSDNTAHDRAFRSAVHDMCLPGRGVVWVVYEAETQDVPQIDPNTQQPAVGVDGQPVVKPQIVKQECREEHVYWRDFLWEPNRAWSAVGWVARRHRMSRADLEANGFEKAADVPMNWTIADSDKQGNDVADEHKHAEVWEIWRKGDKKRYWITKGFAEALRIDDDPYELQDFWPLAEPLSAILGTDSYVPVPFYSQYEDQADDLDEITGRISALVKALKRRGVYDASIPELKRLARAGDNDFIGVDGQKYALMIQSGGASKGLAGSFMSEDISGIAEILLSLHDQRDRLIQSIYEVSGMSDIIRGQSDPNETLGAQKIKAEVGSMRMKDSQRSVQTWVRDTYRIKAELMATNYTDEKWAAVTGMNPQDPLFAQALQVLRSDEMRGYQVDIETDSTVFEDAEAEKAGRVELITAMGGFMQQWIPAIQAQPDLLPLAGELLSFGVRGFKVGRSMEDIIEETMTGLKEKAAQAQAAGPPPDPEMEKIKAQVAQQQQAHDQTMAAKTADQNMKVADHQGKQRAQEMDLKFERDKQAMLIQFERDKMDLEREKMKLHLDFEREKAVMALEHGDRMGEQKIAQAKAAAKAKPKAEANGRSN